VGDQAAEAAAVAAVAPIVAGEMAGMTVILAGHLRLDRTRWGAISATRKGTGPVITGPSRRRKRHMQLRRKNH
jgi:hypothetical protein